MAGIRAAGRPGRVDGDDQAAPGLDPGGDQRHLPGHGAGSRLGRLAPPDPLSREARQPNGNDPFHRPTPPASRRAVRHGTASIRSASAAARPAGPARLPPSAAPLARRGGPPAPPRPPRPRPPPPPPPPPPHPARPTAPHPPAPPRP